MSYYTGRGDYYSGKGDPGFLSTLGGIIGTAGKIVGTVVPGVRTATGIVSSALTSTAKPKNIMTPTGMSIPASVPAIPTPGLTGVAQRLVPGGASGYQCGSGSCDSGYHLDKTTRSRCVRNRKTNYTNPRALSRATKRLDGFVTVARKAMKSTNYKVVSKSYKQNWRKPLKR